MSNNTTILVAVLIVATLWAGTSVYGHYTEMETSVAQAAARAKEMEAMSQALRDAAVASASANQAALARAIEMLGEGRVTK